MARTFDDILRARLSRRQVLGGGAAAGAGLWLSGLAAAGPSSLTFKEIRKGNDADHRVADGYDADVLIRWGDPLSGPSPKWNPAKQTAKAQLRQFGVNADFIGYLPLPYGSDESDHGLLVVNHEFSRAALMFPGATDNKQVNAEQADIEMAAHGMSVIEIRRIGGHWQLSRLSRYARRLTALDTVFDLTGPAAGHSRLRTTADPTGTSVIGTLNNCAGGVTPWGTVLSGEENFQFYFGGTAKSEAEADSYKRYGIKSDNPFGWRAHHPRFDIGREPHEPNRFGWVVEIDPHDPKSTPKKRTALGRFRHEGATTALAPDGRVAVYMGDDGRFQYIYKFVTDAAYDSDNRAANADLLDHGTLHVARFDDDGSGVWLPMIQGQGPLTPANGFHSQGDVVIEARLAAELHGATKMDRPEDVETNPQTGRVYAILTNNSKRTPSDIDAANPRGPNPFGHILEIIPPDGDDGVDHAATHFRWEVLLLAGDPANGGLYHPDTTRNGWLATPDNCTFDRQGRLWIATDGAARAGGFADGLWACDLEGPGRALTRHFYRAPKSAEVCGPCFTPDNTTLFVAVQHPGGDFYAGTFDTATTRWPDFRDDYPPRASVVAITRKDGGPIGG